ncbi:hypothetical protein HK405_005346 [Cladochytrium tenue]|nr:hypothetical protein HK405_005346 [Cladochytrium tenue]
MGLAKPQTTSTPASAAGYRLAPLLNLPPCPASQLAKYAATGWHRPTGSSGGGFLVCPVCFEASLSHTALAALFASAGTNPSGGVAFRCSFSLPWVRVAWAWVLRRNLPDVALLIRAAAVSSEDGLCPNHKVTDRVSKPTAVRTWFTVRNPVNGRLMVAWTICSHCCAAIETILPPFREHKLIVPAALEPCEASCDLVPGSNRMFQYANKMMDFAEESIRTSMADLKPFAKYIEDFAAVPLCPRGTLTSGPCYMFLVLDLAVCEECYKEVVMNRRLRSVVTQDKAFVLNWTCQLYSPRSRRLWAQCESVSDPDSWHTFRQWVIKRADKEREMRLRVEQLKAQTETLRRTIDFYSGLAELRAMSLTHERRLRQLRGSDDGASAASQGNPLQDRVDDDKFRLRSVNEEIEVIERDWRDFWE